MVFLEVNLRVSLLDELDGVGDDRFNGSGLIQRQLIAVEHGVDLAKNSALGGGGGGDLDKGQLGDLLT